MNPTRKPLTLNLKRRKVKEAFRPTARRPKVFFFGCWLKAPTFQQWQSEIQRADAQVLYILDNLPYHETYLPRTRVEPQFSQSLLQRSQINFRLRFVAERDMKIHETLGPQLTFPTCRNEPFRFFRFP